MKKILLIILALSSVVFPLACSDNNPNKASGPALPGGGGTGSGIATSTPNPSGGTLTPSPTIIASYRTSAAPNAMVMDPKFNLLYVAEGENKGTGIVNMIGSYSVAANSLNGGPDDNRVVIGFETPTPPPPTPGITPIWQGVTVVLGIPEGIARSGPYFGLLDTSGSAATLYSGCKSFSLGSIPLGTTQYPNYPTSFGGVPFNSPKSLAGDAFGDFYVADVGNGYVDELYGACSAVPPPTLTWLGRWNGSSSKFPF